METKNQEIMYTLPEAKLNLGRQMINQLEKVTKLSDTLKKWNLPHDVEGIFQRVELGAEHERNQALDEVEKYIKSSKAPEFLRAGMRKTAYDSVDPTMVEELDNALHGWDMTLAREDLEFVGSWSFSEGYLQRKEKELERALDPTMTADFADIEKLFELWQKYWGKYNLSEMISTAGSQRKDAEEIAISMVYNIRGTYKPFRSFMQMND